MSKPSKLSALGFACCLLGCSACGAPGVRTDGVAQPFEKVGWDSGDGTTRFEMATFMVASGELLGHKKTEIHDKFGVPSKEYNSIEGSDWHSGNDWPIGEKERFPVNDKIIFSVFFDKNDVCIESKIRYPD